MISNSEDKTIRIWDIKEEIEVFGKYYGFNIKNYNKIGNIISDEILGSASSSSTHAK